MSSRALRKAQREREEQAQLDKLEQEESDQEYEAPAAKQSAFAMLGGMDGEDENGDEEPDQEDEADEEEGVKLTQAERAPTESAPSSKKSKKKNKKKKKANNGGKAAETPDTQDDDMDEIDKALKQLATNGDSSQAGATAAGVDAEADAANKLWSIDTSHLHAANEMRRLFGRTALEQADDDDQAQAPAGGNRRQQRMAQQPGVAQALRARMDPGGRSGALAAIAKRRNIFIRGKDEWPVGTSGGLGMEIEEKRADGTVLYRFIHNGSYQDTQAKFARCVASMDPNSLVALLQRNPYHISTLLQVSEIAKQERDAATSGDLLERALFSFGRAVHSTFAKSLAEGKARLDFARPENREFWLAAWRYIQNLSIRATWRTVYEWTKLLLSLSPEEDPYALWLVLDQYALRARQDLDYLNVSRDSRSINVHHSTPNIQLSQALAESRAGNPGKGKQALFTAVGRYPWVVARLMQEVGLDPPPSVWGKESRTDKEKLYAELYATRAKDLWMTPEATALLLEVAAAVQPDTPSAPIDATEITINEARQVILSDTPALISLIPRHFTTALSSSSDPLPPPDSIVSYTAANRSAPREPRGQGGSQTEQLQEMRTLTSFFANLIPWFGAGANDAGATEADLARRIAEAGVSEDEIVARTQRLMELREQFGARDGEEGDELEHGLEADEDEEGSEEEREHQV